MSKVAICTIFALSLHEKYTSRLRVEILSWFHAILPAITLIHFLLWNRLGYCRRVGIGNIGRNIAIIFLDLKSPMKISTMISKFACTLQKVPANSVRVRFVLLLLLLLTTLLFTERSPSSIWISLPLLLLFLVGVPLSPTHNAHPIMYPNCQFFTLFADR